METPSCARCGKNSILSDEVTGEQFCGKCGYVIDGKSQESGPNGDHSKKMVVLILQELVPLHPL